MLDAVTLDVGVDVAAQDAGRVVHLHAGEVPAPEHALDGGDADSQDGRGLADGQEDRCLGHDQSLCREYIEAAAADEMRVPMT